MCSDYEIAQIIPGTLEGRVIFHVPRGLHFWVRILFYQLTWLLSAVSPAAHVPVPTLPRARNLSRINMFPGLVPDVETVSSLPGGILPRLFL